MEHTLARELRDAGFPIYEVPDVPDSRWLGKNGKPVGLEELIEACGKGFGSLRRERRDKFDWYASGDLPNGEGVRFLTHTPTEAVARLWIALNKKV